MRVPFRDVSFFYLCCVFTHHCPTSIVPLEGCSTTEVFLSRSRCFLFLCSSLAYLRVVSLVVLPNPLYLAVHHRSWFSLAIQFIPSLWFLVCIFRLYIISHSFLLSCTFHSLSLSPSPKHCPHGRSHIVCSHRSPNGVLKTRCRLATPPCPRDRLVVPRKHMDRRKTNNIRVDNHGRVIYLRRF